MILMMVCNSYGYDNGDKLNDSFDDDGNDEYVDCEWTWWW